MPSDRAEEQDHPSFAIIGANRCRSVPGSPLFDSDLLHEHYMTVTIKTARRTRDINRDWIHSDDQLIQVKMSEAQWASFVSTTNSGDGVPCTLTWTQQDGKIPDPPYDPRLKVSQAEVENAASRALADIKAARDAYEAHKTVGNLKTLHWVIENADTNMAYAAKSMTEHAENVVQRARFDIEAMVSAAEQSQRGLTTEQVAQITP